MFGKGGRVIAVDQRLQPRQVRLVERAVGSDRKTDTVQRNGIVRGNRSQVAMRRAAVSHVVLGMDFEKTEIGFAVEDFSVVLRLEAEARAGRQGCVEKHDNGRS
jgi:hypothetical protein